MLDKHHLFQHYSKNHFYFNYLIILFHLTKCSFCIYPEIIQALLLQIVFNLQNK